MKNHRGQLVVISAPSGGGKNTIIQELLVRLPNAIRLVTTTTRPPRAGEVEGIDYFFIDKKDFLLKEQNGDFVEINEYANNFYGTDKNKLDALLQKYDWVFAAVDVSGKKNYDRAALLHTAIFIVPESLGVLEERLTARGSLDQATIAKRLAIASEEMRHMDIYDAIIVNKQGKLGEAIDQILEFLGVL